MSNYRSGIDTQSSFDRLPPELITEIIVHTETRPVISNIPSLARKSDPPTLALVSNHLREIVLDSPSLWCSFDIAFMETLPESDWKSWAAIYGVVRDVRKWIALSGGGPLRVSVSQSFVDNFGNWYIRGRSQMFDILDILVEQVPRWHEMKFDVHWTCLRYLRTTYPLYWSPANPDVSALQSISYCYSKELEGVVNEPVFMTDLFLPRNQLTYLHLEPYITSRPTLGEVHSLISSSPHLESLSVWATDSQATGYSMHALPDHQLKTLNVHLLCDNETKKPYIHPLARFSNFLSSLAPSASSESTLRELSIYFEYLWHPATPEEAQELAATLTRFDSSLELLHIGELGFSRQNHLFDSLKGLPKLKAFGLDQYWNDTLSSDLLGGFVLPSRMDRGSNCGVAENLEAIRIESLTGAYVLEDVEQIVESRKEHGLKTLELRIRSKDATINYKDSSLIRYWKEEGVDVVLE